MGQFPIVTAHPTCNPTAIASNTMLAVAMTTAQMPAPLGGVESPRSVPSVLSWASSIDASAGAHPPTTVADATVAACRCTPRRHCRPVVSDHDHRRPGGPGPPAGTDYFPPIPAQPTFEGSVRSRADRAIDVGLMKPRHPDTSRGRAAIDSAEAAARIVDDGEDAGADRPATPPWRATMASRVLAAALFGLAEALDPRQRRQEAQVEEAPEPSHDDEWLVLLDRDEPARSLVIIPNRVVSAARAASTAGAPTTPTTPATPVTAAEGTSHG
jgi:hypothetical protein